MNFCSSISHLGITPPLLSQLHTWACFYNAGTWDQPYKPAALRKQHAIWSYEYEEHSERLSLRAHILIYFVTYSSPYAHNIFWKEATGPCTEKHLFSKWGDRHLKPQGRTWALFMQVSVCEEALPASHLQALETRLNYPPGKCSWSTV